MMSETNEGSSITPPDNLLQSLSSRPRKDTRDSVTGLLELLDEVDTPTAMDTDTPTTQLNRLDPKEGFGATSEDRIADLMMTH